jgi:hypothetical protein
MPASQTRWWRLGEQQRQRRFPRIRIQNAVLVSKPGEAEIEEIAATNSIGQGGCGFLSQEQLGEGAIVKLLISIHHQVVRANARVAYEHRLDNGVYDVGVEFIDIGKRELELIQELFEKEA